MFITISQDWSTPRSSWALGPPRTSSVKGKEVPSGGVEMSAWLLLPMVLCHSWLRLILGREQDQGKKTHHRHGYTSSLHLCCGISSAAATTFLAQESSSSSKDWKRKALAGLVFWVGSWVPRLAASRAPWGSVILVEQSSEFNLGLDL